MKHPWGKFYWKDWDSDPALKICSFAAQGLWMRVLCIAARHDPPGYVAVNGRSLSSSDIARLVGASAAEVETLLKELGDHGVFSCDKSGRIYSRRMVRDAKTSSESKKNGQMGGNPSLCNTKKKSRGVNPPDNTLVKPPDKAKSQNPESEIEDLANAKSSSLPQKAARPPPSPIAALDLNNWEAIPDRALVKLSEQWWLPQPWGEYAENLGWPEERITAEAYKFRAYWTVGKGAAKRKSPRGWRQAWGNWIEIAARKTA